MKKERMIIITLDEYKSLIAKTERIEALKRFMTANKYLNADDVMAILGIYEVKESENG